MSDEQSVPAPNSNAAAAPVSPVSPVSTTPPAPSILADAGKEKEDASILEAAKEVAAEKTDKVEKAKAEAPAPAAVPEKYEVKLPEGVTLDQARLDKFTPVAKELGLSNDAVQKLVDFQLEQVKAAEETQKQNFNKFLADTKAETQKEFGARLNDELVYVAKARDTFLSKETLDLLNASGLANHKSIITDLGKIGRRFSEDKLVDGKASVSSQKSDGEMIFDKMPTV